MTARRIFPRQRPGGFTLVELIMVIVITGIIAGTIAVFITRPVTAYVDTVRRAELTENADSALRRIARDLRTALPNSVRVVAVGTATYLEFIPTLGGGRYRQYPTAGGLGNSLDFSSSDGAFDVLGPVPVYAKDDYLAVFNLGPGSDSDAYSGSNRSKLSSSNTSAALFSTDGSPHSMSFAAIQFPSPSLSARFHVLQTPVTYACAPNAGAPTAGVINRYMGYGFVATPQPVPPGVAPHLLVGNVAECEFDYNEDAGTSGAHTRTALVTLRLRLEQLGESSRLVHQVQVVNAP
jgi:MSHA biogenesis protein MshO